MTAGLRLTSADLDRLPDIPGVRYEIIDGELLVSRQPQAEHQYACGAAHVALHSWNEETQAGFAFEVPGLVFADDDDVIPDLIWISRARFAEALDDKGHFRLAPEIVVEAVSPGRANEVRDREIKLALYSRQGVLEYWILDWQARTIEIFRRVDGDLRSVATLSNDDVITSPLLPGFSCPLARLWLPGTF